MEEREFRSPSRNLGSPMTRSVSGALSNAMSGAMTQADEAYRLRKQVSLYHKYPQLLVKSKRSRFYEGKSPIRVKNLVTRAVSERPSNENGTTKVNA